MSLSQLQASFNQSLRWNAALYFLYKILFTSVSFLLFNRLATPDFSVWANVNSFIFLLLLWLDFGLRKSIPRYCPEFKQCGSLHVFLSYVLSAQLLILVAAIPIFLFIVRAFFSSLSLSCSIWLLYCAAFIFLVEGINSSIRLFYHAHFWNKTYALIQGTGLIVEMSINVFCIFILTSSTTLLFALLFNKLVASMGVASVSFIMLKNIHKQTGKNGYNKKIMQKKLGLFVRHSAIMWVSTLIKSLTERNFLVPFLSHTVGLQQANLFKISNDWAMLVHRPIIKTIGVSDTTLLSQSESDQKQPSLPILHITLLKKITLISLPSLAALLVVPYFMPNSTMLALFLIITGGHMIETLLSPYERVLEVKHNYKTLLLSYTPYLVMLCTSWYFPLLNQKSLVPILSFIHASRITCSIIIAFSYHKQSSGSIAVKPAQKQDFISSKIPLKKSTSLPQEKLP